MTALQSPVHEFHSESPAIQQGQDLAISGGSALKFKGLKCLRCSKSVILNLSGLTLIAAPDFLHAAQLFRISPAHPHQVARQVCAFGLHV